MYLGILLDVRLIAQIVVFVLISAVYVIGSLYNLRVRISDAPRWKLAAITVVVAAIIVLEIVLAQTDGSIGELVSFILNECIIAALAIWFLAYIIWIGKPYRRPRNHKQK